MNRFHQFLMIVGSFTLFTVYPIDSSAQKKDTAFLIQKTLHEVNENLLSKRGLRIELLKNYPELISILAEWEYQDWHSYDTSLTKESLEEGFERFLNDQELPLGFVILRDSVPIGVISLDDRSEPELSDLEDSNPWGGSFHITPSERNQGLGEDLAKTLISLAKQLDYEKIHFYTSNSQMVGWYTKRGAKIIETRPYRGHVITIMEYNL